MIEPVKKKLSVIFLTLLTAFVMSILLCSFLFMDYQLTRSVRNHLEESVETEFMPHFRINDVEVLSRMVEDELFQVLNRKGEIIINVQSSLGFSPDLHERLFRAAFEGRQVFDTIKRGDESYIITYYPIDQELVGRAVHPLTARTVFRENFINITLFTLPILLILTYIMSKYMVHQALRPISRVLVYQESFSSSVSHEMNSPLTTMKGSLEVILRKERSPEEYRGAIKGVLWKINDMIDLLKNLSLLATSKYMPLELYREEVDIGELLEQGIEKFEPFIYSNQIYFDVSIQPGLICECDTSLARRAIENLIDNSIKYTPPNGKIVITAAFDTKQLILTFSNTCEDISKDEIKNIFNPFYRGKHSIDNGIEGRGLGLHIVQYIVYSHGGTISAEYTGGMLSFTIKMPGQRTGKMAYQTASSPL